MSLDWYLDEIKDWENVCWMDTGKTDENGTPYRRLRATTDALIWATQSLGMDRINEKTYERFHKRLTEYTNVTGKYMMQRWDETGESFQDINPTLEDIQQHIGLYTNAPNMTQKQWKNHLKHWDAAEKKFKYHKHK